MTDDATPRVLIAYDGSAGAATASHAAARLFPGARALVVTVPTPVAVPATTGPVLPMASPTAVHEAVDALRAEAEEQARTTARDGVERARAEGLQAELAPVAERTPAWAAVLEAAHRFDADVLVCGTRGRGGFARALLGSTSTSLLHETDLPLLVVPDGAGGLDGPVVAAYDGSEGADHAIAALGRLLGDRPVVVVHAWESEFHRSLVVRALAKGPVDELREMVRDLERVFAEDADATTQRGVALARAAGLEATGETVGSEAGAWRTVAAAARSHDAAAIAVGTRGLGAARSALLGSVSSGLVHNAELPVLVVPGPEPPA